MFPTIVTIEGNIGSGKSTLLKRIQSDQSDFLKENGIVLVQEPVDQWMSMVDPKDGESIFAKYYRDPTRYAFLFQVMVFDSIIQVILQAVVDNPGCKILLCERSIASSFEIFATMLADNGTLSPLEHQVCEMMYRNPLYAKYMPTRILYLTTPPELCMERIQMRNRDSEDKITLEYLIKWDDYCHRWLSKTTSVFVRVSQNKEEEDEFDLSSLVLSCA
jgi:deoxyguanosine kinase